jgi:hypothetical protein
MKEGHTITVTIDNTSLFMKECVLMARVSQNFLVAQQQTEYDEWAEVCARMLYFPTILFSPEGTWTANKRKSEL